MFHEKVILWSIRKCRVSNSICLALLNSPHFFIVQHSFPKLRSLCCGERWEKGAKERTNLACSSRCDYGNATVGCWPMARPIMKDGGVIINKCCNPEQDGDAFSCCFFSSYASYVSWIFWWILATMRPWSCCILYPAKMHARAVDDQHNTTTWDQSFAKWWKSSCSRYLSQIKQSKPKQWLVFINLSFFQDFQGQLSYSGDMCGNTPSVLSAMATFRFASVCKPKLLENSSRIVAYLGIMWKQRRKVMHLKQRDDVFVNSHLAEKRLSQVERESSNKSHIHMPMMMLRFTPHAYWWATPWPVRTQAC